MGGKGVKISGEHLHSIEESLSYAKHIVDGGGTFLIEEKFIGEEFSLMSFCDGTYCAHMPAVQDHKRAFEGDVGPNTGGMGTYSFADHSLPFLSKEDIMAAQKTNERVAAELYKKTGEKFRGILYGGFMLTGDGVKVIEYNARFGDPEAMNVLSLLETDFMDICNAIVAGSLADLKIVFANKATVCKYVVPVGYPNNPSKDFEVVCNTKLDGLYLAAVQEKDGVIVATGSRTAAFVGVDPNIVIAERIAEKETESLANLEKNLKGEVYGQDEAIESIVDKVLVNQAGLKADDKPIGSFVFMGPTGTGKTETAKQLAKCLGVNLVRFDMSEYQEKHSVSKLIGSPPGYVGYEENNGLLITKLQESPNCVLLLDEIEKAHADISQILLQLMDNGKVTGSNGKIADARNATLILTTNLGAREAEKNTIGFNKDFENVQDHTELKRFFSPEFRNRLDGVITFAKLGKEVMMKIVGKFLVELKDMVKDKDISITITDDTLDYLVDKGFDPAMGARPLQRVIDKDIKRKLAREMLFGKLKNGGSLTIDYRNGEIQLDCVEDEITETA